MGLPIVRTDSGYDDSFSLWFYNPDQIALPMCHANSLFGSTGSLDCRDQKFIWLEQALNIQQPHQSASSNPDRYRVRLRYSSTALSKPVNISVRVFFKRCDSGIDCNNKYVFLNSEDVPMTPQITAGTMGSADIPAWSQYPAEAIITLDPAMFPANGDIPAWDGTYTSVPFG